VCTGGGTCERANNGLGLKNANTQRSWSCFSGGQGRMSAGRKQHPGPIEKGKRGGHGKMVTLSPHSEKVMGLIPEEDTVGTV